MTDKSRELMPCPFCGARAEIEGTANETVPGLFWEIKCDYCPAMMVLSDIGAVVDAWNRRVK